MKGLSAYQMCESFQVKILLAPGANAGDRLGLIRPRSEYGR